MNNAIRFGKRSLLRLYRSILFFKSYCQYVKSKMQPCLIYDVMNELPTLQGKTLVVAPHSDDEWIGCSQIISRDANVEVYYMQLYGHDVSQNNIYTRDKEIYAMAQDQEILIRKGDNKKESLIRLFMDNKYKQVFMPSPFDWHSQHRETAMLFVKVAKELRDCEYGDVDLFYYNVSVPHIQYSRGLMCRMMSKTEQNNKWEHFSRYYVSQTFMPLYRYALHEKLDSNVSNACELYVKRSISEIENDFRYISSHESNFNDLINKVNDIYAIRSLIAGISIAVKSTQK